MYGGFLINALRGSMVVVFAGLAGCATWAGADRPHLWSNQTLQLSWEPGQQTVTLHNLVTNQAIQLSTGLPSVIFENGEAVANDDGPRAPEISHEDNLQVWTFRRSAKPLPASLARVSYSVRFELNHRTPWIRKTGIVRMSGEGSSSLLKEIVIDSVSFKGLAPRQPYDGWQSYPVLADSFFSGVEFPAAQNMVKDEVARFICRPGIWLRRGEAYAVKPLVFGVSPPGQGREAFEAYIASLRPESSRMHIQYNSWWSAPFPFTQGHMLDLINAFRTQYHDPYAGILDSFCLDMGWAKSRSMWKIDTGNFPKGFSPLISALAPLGARLALWTSPSSCYPMPGGLDSEWAQNNGFETFKPANSGTRYACLAGPKYADEYKNSLVELTTRYTIAHFKFDGYRPVCPERNHGHEPDDYSAEKTAANFIEICTALRKANPGIWLEATCFGYRPSPWWLPYINTVIGTFGDDAPAGRVPCPIYRESYTTARDFYNLQGARDVLIPIYAQEVLGIIHQTEEPLQNDAVVSVLRGHSFIPMYINPRYMNGRRWRFLARLSRWAKDNAELLTHTRALLLGDWSNDAKSRDWARELPTDAYGYAHFHKGQGLLMLRNPWIKPNQVQLTLDDSLGCGHDLRNVAGVSLYPRFSSMPGRYSFGQVIQVALAPYETRLIAFGCVKKAPDRPDAVKRVQARVIEMKGTPGKGKGEYRFESSGDVPQKQLWILAESDRAFHAPECRVTINGSEAPVQTLESTAGWKASGTDAPEKWTWMLTDLPTGAAEVDVHINTVDKVRVSSWLVGKEPVEDDLSDRSPIPPPETRFLDAVEVLKPIEAHQDRQTRDQLMWRSHNVDG